MTIDELKHLRCYEPAPLPQSFRSRRRHVVLGWWAVIMAGLTAFWGAAGWIVYEVVK